VIASPISILGSTNTRQTTQTSQSSGCPVDEGLLTCTTSVLSILDSDDRDGPPNSLGFSCWSCGTSAVDVFPSSFRFVQGWWGDRRCCGGWDSGSSSTPTSLAFMFHADFRKIQDARIRERSATGNCSVNKAVRWCKIKCCDEINGCRIFFILQQRVCTLAINHHHRHGGATGEGRRVLAPVSTLDTTPPEVSSRTGTVISEVVESLDTRRCNKINVYRSTSFQHILYCTSARELGYGFAATNLLPSYAAATSGASCAHLLSSTLFALETTRTKRLDHFTAEDLLLTYLFTYVFYWPVHSTWPMISLNISSLLVLKRTTSNDLIERGVSTQQPGQYKHKLTNDSVLLVHKDEGLDWRYS